MTASLTPAEMNESAWAALERMADALNGALVLADPDDPSRVELEARLASRVVDGSVTFCPHVQASEMQPTFWTPERPGRLRCHGCDQRARDRAEKDRKSRSGLDECSLCFRDIRDGHIRVSAFVVDGFDARANVSIGPITVIYSLCKSCSYVDDDASGDGDD
jgi:hypothetical protein